MTKGRRGFLKKLATVGAVATVGSVAAVASTKSDTYSSNGVVVGKSPKKEILYKKTKAWEEYYNSAL
jgi:hypothetical protein